MSMKVTRGEFVGVDRMGEDELRDLAHELLSENAKLRELALKNWYIALSERHALRAHGIDPDSDAYVAVLDDAIAIAKERMCNLGIEVDE